MSLSAARDLVLPIVMSFAQGKDDYEFDVSVDYTHNKLELLGYRHSTKKSARRVLLLEDIPAKISPTLSDLFAELKKR